jgi:hypothetical protein
LSKVTQLATGQITAVDVLTIELVETDEHLTVVIIRWPDKPSVIHPRRFPDAGRGLPMDYDELERWTRVGYERGMRSRKGER